MKPSKFKNIRLSIQSMNWKAIRRILIIIFILSAFISIMFYPHIKSNCQESSYSGITTGYLEYWKAEEQIQSDMLGKVTKSTRYYIEYSYKVNGKTFSNKIKLKRNSVRQEELAKIKDNNLSMEIRYNEENPKENTIVFDKN